MNSNNYKIPILFILFNRLDTTQKIFNVIRRIKPQNLFIAADGPRLDYLGEVEKCLAVRNHIINHIDWDCEVKTLFRDENIGCGRGPSEAISWFFKHIENGIILEDDCLPNDSFFRFCEENLEKYKNDEKISIISGNNFQPNQPLKIDSSYYFSAFPSTWGWATWRRTWESYDSEIKEWSKINKKKFLRWLFHEKEYRKFWENIFNDFAFGGRNDTWDFQFYFHCMKRRQLAVIPKANLVSNIGHGSFATHTQDENSYFSNLPTYELEFPLKHPQRIERNYEADLFVQKILFGSVEVPGSYKKLKRWIKRQIKYSR